MKKLKSALWIGSILCVAGGITAACGGSGDPAESTGAASGGQGGALGGDGDGDGDASGGASSIAPDLPTPNCDAPVDLGVRIVGRHDGCTAGAVRFAWSGTGFVARFQGTGLSFSMSGNSVQYTVVVDGTVGENIVTTSGEESYVVATGLEAGEHVVEVYRRGEASFGASTLLGVTVEGGELLAPPAAPERRIEIFGDSITCGYGNEGESNACPFSADTENHYLAYGALLARSLDAEVSSVAWSGKGVVSNYGGDMGTTLPEMVDRAVPATSDNVWDYSLAAPADLVIINLGTNDFSTDADPSPEDFEVTYLALLRTIRARYPNAHILGTIGPLLGGADLVTARSAIAGAVETMNGEGDNNVQAYNMTTTNPAPQGCDWHPSLATHEAMATELEPVVRAALGW